MGCVILRSCGVNCRETLILKPQVVFIRSFFRGLLTESSWHQICDVFLDRFTGQRGRYMMTSYQLPHRDELGFCNVLISALGGDGANMGAKMLFDLGCEMLGLDGGYDAKYGSEKKGTPTDVSVRFCALGNPVRQSGPTVTPHILVIFHSDLIRPLELNRGLQRDATCIVNTARSPEEIRQELRMYSGKIICLEGTRIAFANRSRLNMPLLAVLANELGFPMELLKSRIASKWPRVAEKNLAAFDEALGSATAEEFSPNGYPLVPASVTRGPIGWSNMLNGGAIDALTHSTIGRDNRLAGRGNVPNFHPESCTSCGICLTVCSDPGGLIWKDGKMQGVDEQFCKGCMRCVEVCPETKRGKALLRSIEDLTN
jgi:pyruvate ferredoxin oxidoreductase gamma subunit